MKTLFIHLSDIHILENSPVDRIADLINRGVLCHDNKEVNKVFILFTGDMTSKAEKKEFERFKKFINVVTNKINGSLGVRSKTLLVPGNHDITLINRKDVIDQLNKCDIKTKEKLLNDEVSYMSDALNVCKTFDCFKANDIIDIQEHEYEQIKYRFVLVNSAPFSALEKVDKEHHFISGRDLMFPKDYVFGKKTLTLLLEHHRPDWFDEQTSFELNNYIDSDVSIAFFGHEHNPKYEIKEVAKGKVIFDEGGELITKDKSNTPVDGSFSVSYFNEKTCVVDRHTFKLNYNSNTFTENDPKRTSKVRTHEILPLQENFLEDFYRSPLQNSESNLLDLFVMPSITNNKDNFELSSIDTVINKIKQTKEFVIEGSNKIGKSTLMKAIFKECQKKTPCIFLKIESPTNDNVKKLVNDTFKEMYGEDADFSYLKSIPFDERIIFVDNFHILKDFDIKQRFLSQLKEEFGMIVISNNKSDLPRDSIREIGLFNEENIYVNYGLTAKGRKELTTKICEIKNVEERDIDIIHNLYEREINAVSILDLTDPQQGILMLEMIIDQKLYEERKTNKAFTETFKYQLDNMLVQAGREQDLDSYVSILMLLAFKVWSRKDKALFNEQDMMDAFRQCKEEERCHISFKTFSDVILNSGMVYEYGKDQYKFKRNSFLSYYISQEIIRLDQSGEEQHLKELVDNIHYGINSDILLFILFYTKNVRPIFAISKKLDEKYKDVKKLDFSDNKNILFSDETILLEESKKNKLSKKERINKADKKEKHLVKEGAKQEIAQTANQEADEIRKNTIEILKSVEIIAKTISGFQTVLTKDKRKILFNSAYDVLLRTIANCFDFSNETIEELEKDYSDYKSKKLDELSLDADNNKNEIEDLKNSSVKNFLYGLLIETLTLYESAFSYLVTSKNTISIINELPSERFENCVFKLYSYIFMNSFDKFINELKYAKTHFPSNKINNLVCFFGRIYIVHNAFKKEQFDKICSTAGIKKIDLMPYVSREEKIIK